MIEYGGVVIAACVSSIVVSIGWNLNKADKTSEYRQAWINDLREDISSLLSTSNKIQVISILEKNSSREAIVLSGIKDAEDKKHAAEANESSKKRTRELQDERLVLEYEFDRLLNLTLMRLNPKRTGRKPDEEELYIEIEAALTSSTVDRFNLDDESIRDKTKIVLKNEWNRVKRKSWFSTGFIIVLLSLTAFFAYISPSSNDAKSSQAPSQQFGNKAKQASVH
ncbi:hypothetical protein [Tatumella punctata]|uniref:Uncharacterized protein n=1 Tax=Tatumella punctata TaxID=399969 RepID=A0ABW1VRK3_9GAMM